MQSVSVSVSGQLVPAAYVQQGLESLSARDRLLQTLLSGRRLPLRAWDTLTLERTLLELSAMDANNAGAGAGAATGAGTAAAAAAAAGVGEREGRVFSELVRRRHYGMAHGVGRSGDVAAPQPKAAGSSLMARLTNLLVMDAIKRVAGFTELNAGVVLPTATGMALTLVLLHVRREEEERAQAEAEAETEAETEAGEEKGSGVEEERRWARKRYVIWPRIDQKSCFKSIVAAGMEPVVVENRMGGDAGREDADDELSTDVEAVRAAIERLGSDAVLCVMTTTSCFAPRRPDKVDQVAALCSEFGVAHVINNAYGVQSRSTAKLVNRAHVKGRVDFVVQSTDKNFMVPVGGAIVASADPDKVTRFAQTYPGRGSGAPFFDLFVTLLSMGEEGYRALLEQRERNYARLKQGLEAIAVEFGERVLAVPNNPISMALSLDAVLQDTERPATFLGAMLFRRQISGTRVVEPNASKTVEGHAFLGWGAHKDDYPSVYLTAAAAIGQTEEEIDAFLKRLRKVLKEFRRKHTGLSSRSDVRDAGDDVDAQSGNAEEEAAAAGAPPVPPSAR